MRAIDLLFLQLWLIVMKISNVRLEIDSTTAISPSESSSVSDGGSSIAGNLNHTITNLTDISKIRIPLEKLSEEIEKQARFSPGQVPRIYEGQLTFREKCDKYGGPDAFKNASEAKAEVASCLSDVLNFTQLPDKIQRAEPTGDLDLVFNDYCNQVSSLKACVNRFLIKVEPCLADDEKKSKYTIQNITEAILKFACDSEGNHIALFMAEGGPECILGKGREIENCLRAILPERVRNQPMQENDKFFNFLFGIEECSVTYKLRKCITEELKSCKNTTPSNVVDAMFKLIQHSTKCYNPEEERALYHTNVANKLRVALSIIVPASTLACAHLLSL